MSDGCVSLDDLLATNTNLDVQLMRYLMSDRVVKPATEVIDGVITPSEYTQLILDHHIEDLHSRFFEKYLTEVNPTDEQVATWIFDRIMVAIAFLRTARIKPNAYPISTIFTTKATPQLLIMNSDAVAEGHHRGLMNFPQVAEAFTRVAGPLGDTKSINILSHLSKAIGDITSPSWFLYDKKWVKVLGRSAERAQAFRAFLHAATVITYFADYQVVQVFDEDRSEIMKNIELLIDLREDPDTSEQDIREFIHRIEHYRELGAHNPIFQSLFDSPFEEFESHHQQAFGISPGKLTTPPSLYLLGDYAPLFLRNLGDEWVPEVVLATETTPVDYVYNLLKTHPEEVYNGVFKERHDSDDFPPFTPELRKDPMTQAIVQDHVFQTLLLTRLFHYHSGNLKTALDHLKNTSHLLLLLQGAPTSDQLGLSLVGDLLTRHCEKNLHHLSETERTTIARFKQAVRKISFHNPSEMTEAWKTRLVDQTFTNALRTFLFVVIETLNLEQSHLYPHTLGMGRVEFFSYIERSLSFMEGTPENTEFTEFLNMTPIPSSYVLITDWDWAVMVQPFDLIPDLED